MRIAHAYVVDDLLAFLLAEMRELLQQQT